MTNNTGIPIKQFFSTKPALKQVIMRPVLSETMDHKFINLMWSCAHIFEDNCPGWSGYMSSFKNNPQSRKSSVTMLPIINLPATDMTAIFSLLSFIEEQTKKTKFTTTVVTFDQPLYLKAYEIVLTKEMDIFLRLGGFHQLMSFLGSIGCVMEGSGLREALETVYAALLMCHMMTGKAIARSI